LITREALDERVRAGVEGLGAEDLLWWCQHRVEPFTVNAQWHRTYYAVARTEGTPLVFFDEFDSFGQCSEKRWDDSIRLYKDLADAVRCLAKRESMSRLLSETASNLLRMGFLDRDDKSDVLPRTLAVLAAFGPDAALAAPKLIEIASNDDLLGGLQESAVAALAAIGPSAAQVVPILIAMAENDIANARGWCLQAFISIGPAAKAAVPLVTDILLGRVSVDPDSCYAPMAAEALGNIGAIEALPALLQVLQDTNDPLSACAAAEAIGKFGPDAAEAIPILAALGSGQVEGNRFPDDSEIRVTARQALDRIGKLRPIDPAKPA